MHRQLKCAVGLLQDAENNWQFDIFGFAEVTPGNTLSLLSLHFFKVTGIIQLFELDAPRLFSFLQRIESGYVMANPYHNRLAGLCSFRRATRPHNVS